MSLLEMSRGAPWELAYPVRVRHAGSEIFVGACHCPGLAYAWSPERTRYHELDLVREGMHLQCGGGAAQRVVDPTSASLHAPGDEYAVSSPTAHPQRSTLILVRGALADELVPAHVARTCHVSAAAARLHFQLVHAADPVALEETAVALAHRVFSEAAGAPLRRRTGSPAWRRLTEELQHVMATRFHERLTVESMAAACGASTFHACRVFRAVTGETLHRYLTRVRLRAALFKLDRAPGGLARIALEAGFSSHSHFTKAFRLEFGSAPSSLFATPRGRGHDSPASPASR